MINHDMRLKFLIIIFFIIMGQIFCTSLCASDQSQNEYSPILIISSYNPDATRIYSNISDFIDEYKFLGGKASVLIENMNCKSYSELPEWKYTMERILYNYKERDPALIILLGQEAFTSYASQSYFLKKDIPVICGLISSTMVPLPENDSIASPFWMPECVDVFDSLRFFSVRGGAVYDYDVVGNVNLIKKIYPYTKNIVFISDNSFGGVSLQACVRREMKKFPDLNLILLDGRSNTLFSIIEKIHTVPKNSVILLGSWRVDMDDKFYMNDALYMIRGDSPDIPVFTLTSTGMGQLAIGGIYPKFRSFGVDLAKQAMSIINNPQLYLLEKVKNTAVFDYNILIQKNIDKKLLPYKYEVINKENSFFVENKLFMIVSSLIFVFMLIISLITVHVSKRRKKMNTQLLISEDSLRMAKEAAEESNRLKSAFLANMSHEIRTPLNVIVGFSEILSETDNEEQKKECVAIINNNNDLLLHLINDILDLSKIEADTMDYPYLDFNLNALFFEIESYERVRLQKENKNIEIIFEKYIPNFIIHSVKNRIHQIITNFITNAIKFTEEGKITFGYEICDDNIRFYVTDTGCGIPKDKREVIFDRFVKLDGFKNGTGLGLSICQMIVKKLNGKIGVDSEVGIGSTFWFTLPYSEKKATNSVNNIENAELLLKDDFKTKSMKTKPTLLIAEDNQDNYLLFDVLLRDKFNLIHAEDGKEAVDIFKEKGPSLSAILMDIKMPNMDGYLATKTIRQINNKIPIIAVTAYAFENEKIQINDRGFNDYITKPISAENLFSVLDRNIVQE